MADPLIRTIGVLTTSNHKVTEIRASFSLYGIDVIQVTVDSNFLHSSTNKKHIHLGIIKEQTSLVKRGTLIPATKSQLEAVDHISELTFYRLNSEGKEEEHKFVEKTEGYIDLTRYSGGTKIYDWDDIFVVKKCNRTYVELAQRRQKISSRDMNVSKVIQNFIHYKKLKDCIHVPQNFTQVIDFRHTFREYYESVPEFHCQHVTDMHLDNIFKCAMNQGAYFKSAGTRREGSFFCPGLGGIPLTAKPKDRIHEITYQTHDISHHCIPDLVFTGNTSDLSRKVYIAYRLMSECFTLVIADMLFVSAMLKSGINYETVNMRKIYPLFTEIEKSNPSSPINQNWGLFLYQVFRGSFEHCFYGQSRWKDMINDKTVYEKFAEKYDAYFMADFEWTSHNWFDMASYPSIYSQWWDTIKHWRALGHHLELQSVEEFIEENNLQGIKYRSELLDAVFEAVYKKYIKRLFSDEDFVIYTPEYQLRNAFVRYMMGQSIIFFQHDYFEMSKSYLLNIERTLLTQICNIELIDNVRAYYGEYIDQLKEANLITGDDAINYKDVCPIFQPMYVNYNVSNKEQSVAKFVEEILG